MDRQFGYILKRGNGGSFSSHDFQRYQDFYCAYQEIVSISALLLGILNILLYTFVLLIRTFMQFCQFLLFPFCFLQIEKKKCLQIFLLHFIQTYNNWEPRNHGILTEREIGTEDSIAGCSFGHPSEVMLILVQELTHITSLVSDSKSKVSLLE